MQLLHKKNQTRKKTLTAPKLINIPKSEDLKLDLEKPEPKHSDFLHHQESIHKNDVHKSN
ncbi:MAG: hypothetical protein HUU56_07490 [Bdellovibrionaceae bacterium]|nr:hypothetical protein [Pseudobdellovibrionaceae bacterium]